MDYHRRMVAQALKEIAQDIRFIGGKSSLPVKNETITVYVSLGSVKENNLARHHVMVCTGMSSRFDVEGLLCVLSCVDTGEIVLKVRTNRCGQAELPNLEVGREYSLSINVDYPV